METVLNSLLAIVCNKAVVWWRPWTNRSFEGGRLAMNPQLYYISKLHENLTQIIFSCLMRKIPQKQLIRIAERTLGSSAFIFKK